MSKTIGEMTAEVWEYNIAKGWRPADGGPGENTFGDYIALLHSEIGEATDAYRKWRLADPTPEWVAFSFEDTPMPKPEGVGAELADVLIRLLSTCDAWGIPLERDFELGDVAEVGTSMPLVSFGDHMAWLGQNVAAMWNDDPWIVHQTSADTLRALVTIARKYGIDLDTEYERKMAHNRTRPYHHGGTMADPSPTRPRAALMPHVRLDNLRNAMPTDERGWWTGEEMGEFIDEWRRLKMPDLTMSDGQGDTVLFWCRDVQDAAAMIGMSDHVTNDDSFDIRRGEYTASIVQADEKK